MISFDLSFVVLGFARFCYTLQLKNRRLLSTCTEGNIYKAIAIEFGWKKILKTKTETSLFIIDGERFLVDSDIYRRIVIYLENCLGYLLHFITSANYCVIKWRLLHLKWLMMLIWSLLKFFNISSFSVVRFHFIPQQIILHHSFSLFSHRAVLYLWFLTRLSEVVYYRSVGVGHKTQEFVFFLLLNRKYPRVILFSFSCFLFLIVNFFSFLFYL